MKVRDIMTSEVATVAPDVPVKEAVTRLLGKDVNALPVTAADGTVVGIVTASDLLSKRAYHAGRRHLPAALADLVGSRDHRWASKARGAEVRDLMSARVATCGPDEDVTAVAKRMLESRVNQIPVIDGGRLAGIVARRDILATFDRPDPDIEEAVRRKLTDPLQAPNDQRVHVRVEHGVVTLEGEVRYRGEVPVFGLLAAEVPGVIEVVNKVKGREPDPHPDYLAHWA